MILFLGRDVIAMGNTFGAEVMEKLATRAWKKHWGDLSQNAQSQLVRKNVLNRAKELEGLEKGTANILKKTNSTITDNPKKAAIHAAIHEGGGLLQRGARFISTKKYAQKGEAITATPGNNHIIKSLKDTVKTAKRLKSGDKKQDALASSLIAQRSAIRNRTVKKNPKQTVFVPNKEIDAANWNAAGGYKKNSAKAIKSDFDKRYLNALTKRHEAYETVAALKKAKSQEPAMRAYVSSHHSTYVPMMESKDVAIAPRKVKQSYIDIRKNDTGELNSKNKYYGSFVYAKSAVPERKAAKGLNKTISKWYDKNYSDKGIEDAVSELRRKQSTKK